MLRFAHNVESSKLQAKADFGFTCIKTGMHYKDLNANGLSLEGVHLFQISTFPKLETCIDNIFSLNTKDHRDRRVECLDYLTYKDTAGWSITRNRTPIERVTWLLTHTHADYRQRVRERLEVLFAGIEAEVKDPELKSIAEDAYKILEEN